MAEAIAKITVVDQNWLDANQNEKVDLSLFSRLQEYVGKTGGVYRLLSGLQKSLRIGNTAAEEMGYKVPATIKTLDTNFGISANALVFARLPQATVSAMKAVFEVKEDDGIPIGRKVMKAVRDVADAAAAFSFASLFLKYSPNVLRAAQTADLTTDVLDAKISAEDYVKAAALEEVAVGDAKEAITHTKNYNFWRVAKAVTGSVATVFGLIGMIFGAYLLPAIALVILGLSATILAVIRDNHKEMGQYRVIDFDRDVRIV